MVGSGEADKDCGCGDIVSGTTGYGEQLTVEVGRRIRRVITAGKWKRSTKKANIEGRKDNEDTVGGKKEKRTRRTL
jgi:hypothetical protein